MAEAERGSAAPAAAAAAGDNIAAAAAGGGSWRGVRVPLQESAYKASTQKWAGGGV
jgi:hypothetical protein